MAQATRTNDESTGERDGGAAARMAAANGAARIGTRDFGAGAARSGADERGRAERPSGAETPSTAPEGELAGLWLGLAREQMRHNLETLRRLAEARDWREAMVVQSDFVRDSITRTADGMCRQVDVAAELATGALAAVEEATARKAA